MERSAICVPHNIHVHISNMVVPCETSHSPHADPCPTLQVVEVKVMADSMVFLEKSAK